jgi:hypothetical protein
LDSELAVTDLELVHEEKSQPLLGSEDGWLIETLARWQSSQRLNLV